jgi:hypothetical protein
MLLSEAGTEAGWTDQPCYSVELSCNTNIIFHGAGGPVSLFPAVTLRLNSTVDSCRLLRTSPTFLRLKQLHADDLDVCSLTDTGISKTISWVLFCCPGQCILENAVCLALDMTMTCN